MAIEMIKQVTCDTHGTACKAKPEEIATRVMFDIVTGLAKEKEICAPEWEKIKKNNETIFKDARDISSASTSNGSPATSAQAAEKLAYKPLIDAAKAWHKETFGESLRGQPGVKGEKVQQFIKSPAGKAWADWKPGDPEPSGE